ncbi:MAG: potassium channel family protein [Nocardioides sp.]|nr:potassium channel family protein [Nocardioides sp.]
MTAWLLTLVGLGLVATAVRDIFHTLWHPHGFGGVSRLLFRVVWRLGKPWNRGTRSTEMAGPLGLVLTAVCWTALIVGGFALVYLPHLPEGFHHSEPPFPRGASGIEDALYVSAVALATLGFGDIVPATPWLRAVVPLQALLGFVLLTAAISWVLQLYPALTRRRGLARRLDTMARTDAAETVEHGDPSIAVGLLEGVREGLSEVEMDLLQYGESYYFREREPRRSLPACLPQVDVLIAAGARSESPEVRRAATMLDVGLAALLDLVCDDFLDTADADDPRASILATLAADHQHEPGHTSRT